MITSEGKVKTTVSLHPSVLNLALVMQKKLDERLGKYPVIEGIDNWKRKDVYKLIEHLHKEVKEFEVEVLAMKALFVRYSVQPGGETTSEMISKHQRLRETFEAMENEAADICNLAMMVMDCVLNTANQPLE